MIKTYIKNIKIYIFKAFTPHHYYRNYEITACKKHSRPSRTHNCNL